MSPPGEEDFRTGVQQDLFQYHFAEPDPHQGHQDLVPQGGPPGSQRAAFKSSPSHIERLRALPEVRPIPWRAGQELLPEKAIDSPRVQQRGAILLSTRGNVVGTPCTHCAAGFGRFSQCITLEPWFQGACSTCIFTSKGNKCSLRHEASGTADGRALRYHSSNPEMLKSYILSKASDPPKPPRKRKRRSEADNPPPNINFSAPPSNIAESFPSAPPDLDRLLQADIAGRQTPDAREQSYQLEKKQKHRENAAQDDMADTTNTPKHILPRGKQPSNAISSTRGWTAPNTPNPTAEPVNYIRTVQHANTPTPSTQPANYLPTVQHATTPNPSTQSANYIETVLHGNTPNSAAKLDPSGHTTQPSTSAIDALPKEKQRHIHVLLSRMQGNVDHLQQQMNFLKAVLGMEIDEPGDVR
ncbi:uncharacterized protein BP5553_06340 [Venustampulla echinocandica]|uniref:Uncharacterized protein n=1 Tax=Venustampulla echinocandica TaxID=2656787 RepID=A0A370TJM1_9HELO|nr:uncharacterized protein BP5553_06340 [Venustampulla echinocandica]RDL35728.1 hypothetical protein BP5553_06340 [Venustampulla echinocandica]